MGPDRLSARTEASVTASAPEDLSGFESFMRDPVRIVYDGYDLETALQACWISETLLSSGTSCRICLKPDVLEACDISPSALISPQIADPYSAEVYSNESVTVFLKDSFELKSVRIRDEEHREISSLLEDQASEPPWAATDISEGPIFASAGWSDGGLKEDAVRDIAHAAGAVIMPAKDQFGLWQKLANASALLTDCPAAFRLARARGVPSKIISGPNPHVAWWYFLKKSGGINGDWLPVQDERVLKNVVKRCQCSSHKECHALRDGTREAPCGIPRNSSVLETWKTHMLEVVRK